MFAHKLWHLITVLEAREAGDLTFAFFEQKILAENQCCFDNSSCDKSESALAVNSKHFECYFCKKMGHMKKGCIRYKTWLSKQGEK